MAPIKSQNSNMLLAFLTLLGVIAIVAVVGFFMLRKGPKLYRDRLKLPNIAFQVKFGTYTGISRKKYQSVNAGDTLTILKLRRGSKMEQARAAEAAAQATKRKSNQSGAREEQIQAAYEMWQKPRQALPLPRNHINASRISTNRE